MRNQNLTIISIILLSLLFLSCADDNKSPTENNKIDIEPIPQKEWTYLFYDDADFKYAYDPLEDFSALVSSNSDINYLVLRDRNDSGAEYYAIDEEHNYEILHSLGEVNMGSSKTLDDFIKFAKKYFPARRYIVAFYDHGGGWMGTCWDMGSNNDNLTMSEINDAFILNQGVDIVLFTAPCLMGSLEAAYQLRNSSNFYIGSESTSGFNFWMEMLDKFDFFIKSAPTLSSQQISKKIIEFHSDNIKESEYGDLMTMSAIDLSKINKVVISLNELANYYNSNLESFVNFPFSNVKVVYERFIDYKNFLEELYVFETSDEVKGLINKAILSFDECIVAECHGDSMKNTNGLNIYYRNTNISSELYYLPYSKNLDFINDSKWDDLLVNSFGKVNALKSSDFVLYELKTNCLYP